MAVFLAFDKAFDAVVESYTNSLAKLIRAYLVSWLLSMLLWVKICFTRNTGDILCLLCCYCSQIIPLWTHKRINHKPYIYNKLQRSTHFQNLLCIFSKCQSKRLPRPLLGPITLRLMQTLPLLLLSMLVYSSLSLHIFFEVFWKQSPLPITLIFAATPININIWRATISGPRCYSCQIGGNSPNNSVNSAAVNLTSDSLFFSLWDKSNTILQVLPMTCNWALPLQAW